MNQGKKPQEPMRPMKGVRVPGQKMDFKVVKRILSYADIRFVLHSA